MTAHRDIHDITRETPAVAKVAANLSEIINLHGELHEQAINSACDPLMPGGLAMVALGNVASLDEWSEQVEAAEHKALAEGRKLPAIDDEDDWEPPLQTLLFWSESWRTIHGYPLSVRPTISGEANFIRWALGWAWENDPRFEDFAKDVAKTRRRLEDVLKAGSRPTRTRVVCDHDACERKPRLILVYGNTEADDHHKCPSCKTVFDMDAFKRAHARQLRSEGAEKFVVLADAIGTLRAQGRSERTIRKWFAEQGVEGYCDVATHSVYVWWPDLWRLHLSTQIRKRAS